MAGSRDCDPERDFQEKLSSFFQLQDLEPMSQWSETFERKSEFRLPDGRIIKVTDTYIDLLDSHPFCEPSAEYPRILKRVLLNIRIDGGLNPEDEREYIDWRRGSCFSQTPKFLIDAALAFRLGTDH
jgi:hypothetical protein